MAIDLNANDIFRTDAMRYDSYVNNTFRERNVYRDRQSIGLPYGIHSYPEKLMHKKKRINRMKMKMKGAGG